MVGYILIGIIWAVMFGVSFSATYDEYDSLPFKVVSIILSIIFAPVAFGMLIGKKLSDY